MLSLWRQKDFQLDKRETDSIGQGKNARSLRQSGAQEMELVIESWVNTLFSDTLDYNKRGMLLLSQFQKSPT